MSKKVWHKLDQDARGDKTKCGIDLAGNLYTHWVVNTRQVTCKNCRRKLGVSAPKPVTPKRSHMQASYVDALVFRIVGELTLKGTLAWNTHGTTYAAEKTAERIVRKHVIEVMDEIQHRLYQYPIAELQDIARDLHPETERK